MNLKEQRPPAILPSELSMNEQVDELSHVLDLALEASYSALYQETYRRMNQ